MTITLSQNVKINNRATATKGSKSKTNPPMHLPMPPGVKFTKTPNNEGEVTGGTIPNVKVNNKEIAVLGSMVTTCNDPMPQETCKIIAIGLAPKVPIEIPVTNPIDRSVINPKWDKAKATIGEKVKLQVQLKNQYNNATVEYKIYPEGADTKKDQPIQKLYGRNEGGRSEVEWEFKRDAQAPGKAKYFFTAVSFGCAEVKGGIIEQKKPEFMNLKWKKDDKEIKTVYVDEIVALTADCQNLDESVKEVKIHIYEKDYTAPEDRLLTVKGIVKDGKKIEGEWKINFIEDEDSTEEEKKEEGYILSEYVFIIETEDADKSQESSVLDVENLIEITLEDEYGNPASNEKYIVYNMKDEKIAEGNLDENGYAKAERVKAYKVYVEFPYKENIYGRQ